MTERRNQESLLERPVYLARPRRVISNRFRLRRSNRGRRLFSRGRSNPWRGESCRSHKHRADRCRRSSWYLHRHDSGLPMSVATRRSSTDSRDTGRHCEQNEVYLEETR